MSASFPGATRRTHRRALRRLAAPLCLLTAAALVAVPLGVPAASAATPERRIDVRGWQRGALDDGTLDGTRRHRKAVRLEAGRTSGAWTSPWVEPGFTLTELIPSWHAATPGAGRVDVEVRGRTASRTSSWDTVARWARDDAHVRRASGSSQTDDLGRLLVDTWATDGVTGWQVRVTLHRTSAAAESPRLVRVGAMASRLPSVGSVSTSRPGAEQGAALGTVLSVPRYSQMVHRGEYEQYDGGGEAWCSPTSLTMVLAYYDALPPARAYSWVRRDYPDRVVAHLARQTYDTAYSGTGNWPFNTAYAATRTGAAFVTRLRSLREAERFIAAGIPLVASVSFGRGELGGAPISSTNGHLLVIAGFRANGDVVVNDPAASSRSGVRRTYDRGQFEDAWLQRQGHSGGSGGLVYVVRDEDHPLPEREAPHNW